MATLEPVYAASFDSMESRKRRINKVPLPYLIRPRRKLPEYDSYELYNDYLGYSSIKGGIDSESDDDDSSTEAVETSSLEKGNVNLSETGVSAGSLSDEEYVVVDNVEVLPSSKTERAGAIQMMELSKDAADESAESEDAGSMNVDWVVV